MTSDKPLRRRGVRSAGLIAILALIGCADGTPVDPPVPPQITVNGVEDGGVYEEPVVIEISVDRGSVSSTLNGQTVYSGTVVEAPGSYVLEVVARASGLETVERVEFEIVFTGESLLIIRMINLGPDVEFGGGGDAILLTDSSAVGMVHAMVDAGPGGFGQIDHAFVARRLGEIGVDTLQFLHLTHAHADHYGGMQEILDRVHVRDFLYNGQVRSLASYQNTLSRAGSRADTVIVVDREIEYMLGFGDGATRMVHLPPLDTWLNQNTNDGTLLNEGSLGMTLERGPLRMFFTGDSEYDANVRWRTTYADQTRNLEILKVGHHGANNAVFDRARIGSASTWMDHTNPRIGIVSANGRSHPRQAAVQWLGAMSSMRLYCTNVHGDIEIRVDEAGTYRVDVEREPDADCVAGLNADT